MWGHGRSPPGALSLSDTGLPSECPTKSALRLPEALLWPSRNLSDLPGAAPAVGALL